MSENSNYKLTIGKDSLAALPAAHYTGSIVIVDKPDDVSAAVEALSSAKIIGFDTETKPSFKKGQTNYVSLIQLSADDKCFLFRINMTGIPDSLKALLESPDVLKIGLSLHDDFHNLAKVCQIQPQGFVDLQQYVKGVYIADNSLSKIYAIVFGKRISKGQRLSNWEAESLSRAQQQYAALDAKACVDIYQSIDSGQFHPDASLYKQPIEEEGNQEA